MNRLALGLLLAAVALTRIPLLPHGYGADPDAWRVASSAFRLWTTGAYEVSRYPGYPLHEMVSAPFVALGGAAGSNGATLAVALLLIVLWNRMTLREARHPALLVLTLALTPLFLRNSATTMDYVWSMLFVLLALDRALCRRALAAGALMGVAAGFRLNNLVALIPVGVALLGQVSRRPADHGRLRSPRDHCSHPDQMSPRDHMLPPTQAPSPDRVLLPHQMLPAGQTSHPNQTSPANPASPPDQSPQRIQSSPALHVSAPSRAIFQLALSSGAALAVTIVCFLPVLLTVGMERWYAETAAQLASVRQYNELGLRMFLYRGVYAFGPLAVVAAALLSGARWKELAERIRETDPVVRSAVAAFVAYGLLFLSLPMEREYLLPLLPFGLLLLDRVLTRGRLLLLMLFVVSFGFVNPDVVSHQTPVGRIHPNLHAGLLVEECDRRNSIEETRREILALKEPEKTIVVTGFPEPCWFGESGVERVESPFHEQLFRNRTASRTRHIFSLSPPDSALARSLGFSILPLRDARKDTVR